MIHIMLVACLIYLMSMNQIAAHRKSIRASLCSLLHLPVVSIRDRDDDLNLSYCWMMLAFSNQASSRCNTTNASLNVVFSLLLSLCMQKTPYCIACVRRQALPCHFLQVIAYCHGIPHHMWGPIHCGARTGNTNKLELYLLSGQLGCLAVNVITAVP